MINAKVDLLKVSKDIVEHLHEVVTDLRMHCLAPQGQAQMTALALAAADSMAHLVASLESAPDDAFAMIEEPAKEHPPQEQRTQKPHSEMGQHGRR